MTVHLEYHAQIRSFIGKSADTLVLAADTTVQQAIHALLQKYGEDVRGFLTTPEGELRPSILLFLGDRQVRWSVPTPLKDGDQLLLLSPIAGG